MEEQIKKKHSLHLEERCGGILTGIVDVMAFDEKEIKLETTKGLLTIYGRELHIQRLHLEDGEVDIEGTIDGLIYKENHKENARNLLKRLKFR